MAIGSRYTLHTYSYGKQKHVWFSCLYPYGKQNHALFSCLYPYGD